MVNIRSPWMFQDLVQELESLTRSVDWAFGDTTLCPEAPKSELRLSDTKAVMEVDLPGVQESDLSIELEGDRLQVNARRSDLHKENENVVLRERTFGEFHRTVQLPWPVDSESVVAHFDHGVLHITLSRAPEAKPKRIHIQRTS